MIRRYRLEDAPALIALYRDSVTGIGPRAYDAAQVAAWAAHPEDPEAFRDELAEGLTLVACEADTPAAFGQLCPWDRIAYLYARPDQARRGLGREIYRRLEEEARIRGESRLTTAASRLARPFFEAMGFHLRYREIVTRQGVEIERFEMEKSLA